MDLYIKNATLYIQNRAIHPKTPTISRAEFELRVLTELDISTLDTEYKLAWMNAVSLCPVPSYHNLSRPLSSSHHNDYLVLLSS